jgi:hypothetical protein
MDVTELRSDKTINCTGSEFGLVKGFCEQCNEPSGYVTGVTFLDQLSDYQLLKKDSASCSQQVKETWIE